MAIPEVNIETKIRRDHPQEEFIKTDGCSRFQGGLNLDFPGNNSNEQDCNFQRLRMHNTM